MVEYCANGHAPSWRRDGMAGEPNGLKGVLIGCGFVSDWHLAGWRSCPSARLVAVCDLEEGKARAAADSHGLRAYTNAAAMIREERPDFVDIATRPDTHLELVRLAARPPDLGPQCLLTCA